MNENKEGTYRALLELEGLFSIYAQESSYICDEMKDYYKERKTELLLELNNGETK